MDLRLTNLIAQNFGLEADEIHNSLTIDNCPSWTSITHMTLISSIEEEYQIQVPIQDVFELTSVLSIDNYIQAI